MSEVAPAGGGPNRLFIVLALGLVGLLIIGVVALGGIFAIQQMTKPAVVPTATRVSIAITTPTRPPLPTATSAPTNTPLPPTPTRVVQAAGGDVTPASGGAGTPTVGATVTVTGTVRAGTGTPAAGMPDTGIGENLLLLAGGLVLVFVIFAARRARSGVAG